MAGGLMRIRTAALAVVMAVGLVGGVGAAASAAETRLAYTCAFPAGKAAVGVTVAASFPGHAAVGKPFRPTDVTTTVRVPATALGDLAKATTISASTQLTVKVAQDGSQPANAAWLGDAPATKVPGGGDLPLTAAGDVPTVTVGTSGTVSFAAASLDLSLTPDSGAPVSVTCTPVTGQSTALGSVPVGDTTGSATPTPTASSPSARPSPGRTRPGGRLPEVTPGATKPGSRSPHATPHQTPKTAINAAAYKTCADPASYTNPKYFAVSGYLAGYANVRKVNGAGVVGDPTLGVFRSDTTKNEGLNQNAQIVIDGVRYLCVRTTGELDFHGERALPPITTTAPAFGFVPVTATAHLSQVGDEPVQAIVYQQRGSAAFAPFTDNPYQVVATAQLSLRLSDVKVNGVALDVGDQCRTTRSLYTPDSPADPGNDRVVFVGGDDEGNPTPIYAMPFNGGASAGDVTIPPFHGCVTPQGDDLDNLLNASVAGVGNYSKLVQGPLCPGIIGCPPGELQPVYQPVWTLTHGGDVAASGPLTFSLDSNQLLGDPGTPAHASIACAAHTMTGTAFNGSGPPRGDQADLRLSGIRGCTEASGATWEVNKASRLAFDGSTYDPATGTTKGRGLLTMTLARTAPDPCSITLTGAIGITYVNSTGTLSLLNVSRVATGERWHAVSSTCGEFPANQIFDNTLRVSWGTLTATYTLPPEQAFTLTSP